MRAHTHNFEKNAVCSHMSDLRCRACQPGHHLPLQGGELITFQVNSAFLVLKLLQFAQRATTRLQVDL